MLDGVGSPCPTARFNNRLSDICSIHVEIAPYKIIQSDVHVGYLVPKDYERRKIRTMYTLPNFSNRIGTFLRGVIAMSDQNLTIFPTSPRR